MHFCKYDLLGCQPVKPDVALPAGRSRQTRPKPRQETATAISALIFTLCFFVLSRNGKIIFLYFYIKNVCFSLVWGVRTDCDILLLLDQIWTRFGLIWFKHWSYLPDHWTHDTQDQVKSSLVCFPIWRSLVQDWILMGAATGCVAAPARPRLSPRLSPKLVLGSSVFSPGSDKQFMHSLTAAADWTVSVKTETFEIVGQHLVYFLLVYLMILQIG